MQCKKYYQEKLFVSFRLSDHVPESNFYRRLKSLLDLNFLYELTKPYYGKSGQKSIDPVVFFRLCLVGYLENIVSDLDWKYSKWYGLNTERLVRVRDFTFSLSFQI